MYVALLRGINVGGNNPLPMKSLVSIMERLGCADVSTYIQSGNVVFRKSRVNPARFGREIAKAINASHGFEPPVLVVTATELQDIAAANPFPDKLVDAKFLHVYFLAEVPQRPDLAALNRLKADSESFVLAERAFYLHAPDGIGRSKLAASAEKLIGVDATARNGRTVSKLLELCRNGS